MSKQINTIQRRDRVVPKAEVLAMFGNISSPTLYRWIASGRFPRQVKMGPNRIGFLESEIDAHLVKLQAQRDAEVA